MLRKLTFKIILLAALCCGMFTSILAQDVRGLYVNDFKNIIGQPEKEAQLLQFAQAQGFNYLLLYNFYFIHHQLFSLTDAQSALPMANFIQKAKTQYGITEVGAVGETFASFDIIDQYNQLQANRPEARLDVYNIEYEFWNKKLSTNYYCTSYLQGQGIDCSTEGSFQFYIAELQKLHQLAKLRGVKAETYIGLPTDEQCQQIGQSCDRVLVHYYRTSDVYNNGNSIYNFKSARLPALAPTEGQLAVMPIFASRSHFMGPWLTDHPEEQAFETFIYGQNGYEAAQGDWKAHLKIEGYQWYRYTDLLNYLQPTRGDLVLAPNLVLNEKRPPAVSTNYRLPGRAAEGPSLRALQEALAQVVPYPNPADQQLLIKTKGLEGAEVVLFDISGQKHQYLKVGTQDQIRLQTASLTEGVYFLRVRMGKEQVVRKVVIVHL
ncbi:MAG: T9SS type A sorting domain-containing protein [Bacteroidota bacterium]